MLISKKRFNISCVVGVLIIFGFGGCAPKKENTRKPMSEILKSRDENKINKSIDIQLDNRWKQDYCDELLLRYGIDGTSNEGKTYSNICKNIDEIPFTTDKFSIALSGGGTRSASFSMGVLKSLEEMELLQKLDSISSVSGGGYTAYWYYMNRYYQHYGAKDKGPDYSNILSTWQIDKSNIIGHPFCQSIKNDTGNHKVKSMFLTPFDKEGKVLEDFRFQEHIEQQSDIINYSQNQMTQSLETSGILVTHILSLPVYMITDGIFNFGVFNGSVLTNAYRKGLERTYGLVPNTQHEGLQDYFSDEPDQYLNGLNGTFLFWQKNAKTKEVFFRDLRAFNQAYNMCVVAINKENKEKFYPMSLPIINTNVKRPASLFKDANSTARSLENSVFTFTPLAWGSEYKGFNNDTDKWSPIRISKAYAISGAAADKAAREASFFHDIGLEVLNGDLGYDIRNPEYEYTWQNNTWVYAHKVIGGFPLGYLVPEIYNPQLHLSDGGHAENLGAYSLIKRGTQKIIIVDAEHDPDYVFDALNRLKVKLKAEIGLELKCKEGHACPIQGTFMADRAFNPVFPLEVVGLTDKQGKKKKIDILYVKLSIDKDKIDDPNKPNSECYYGKGQVGEFYPCHISEYYLEEKDKDNNAFPHNSTADIWYQKEQYRAFRDLGNFIGAKYLKESIEENEWIESIEGSLDKEKSLMKIIMNKHREKYQ